MDVSHFGTSEWNPFGVDVKPGNTVVVKPNLVIDRHAGGGDVFSIITHPSVLRAIIDYIIIALQGQGHIIIADAPQYNCDWENLMSLGFGDLVEFYRRYSPVPVSIRDLRNYWSPGLHHASLMRHLPGDPQGALHLNLGARSELYSLVSGFFHGACHSRIGTNSYHDGMFQRYDLARTMTDADVVISVPKLKTHSKVGVTLGAKGLVGICTDKNMLVHYTLGPPSQGGDQYPDGNFNDTEQRLIDLERWMYDNLLFTGQHWTERLHRFMYWLHNHTTRKLGLKVRLDRRALDAGNWYGNDTCWRMVYDLMFAWHYYDKTGHMADIQTHRLFTLIDGVRGGDQGGPLKPRLRTSRALIGSRFMVEADMVAARLMGFDISRIPMYNRVLRPDLRDGRYYGLQTEWAGSGCRLRPVIYVTSNIPSWSRCMVDSRATYLDYEPAPGWVGHIEIQEGG